MRLIRNLSNPIRPGKNASARDALTSSSVIHPGERREQNADIEAKERHQKLLNWCKSNGKPIGDKEFSQAFLWRVLDFLKENGKAGMLVSAGVLFKHHKTSQAFRREWMDSIKLEEVFNFSHVREFFFKGAISPFTAMLFKKKNKAIPRFITGQLNNARLSKTINPFYYPKMT